MHRPKSAAALAKQCERWNRANPMGTTVMYYPTKGSPKYCITTTKSEAYVLSGHTAVIFLDGIRGCVALDHCTPTEPVRNG